MYKTILITGANGFIGKNLIQELHKKNFNILTFIRSDTLDDLQALLKKTDFIFHLAGEVKPTCTHEELEKGNISLTKYLIYNIEKADLKIPIVMTSSIHAKNPTNDYGRTKLIADNLLIEYQKRNNVPVYIYRLPHMFGEGCKPNYNSVISTWMYNSLRHLEINVYDRSIPITYIYVKDFITTSIEHLEVEDSNPSVFQEITEQYSTTLGEVVDIINEFYNNIENESYYVKNNIFKQKLFKTYQDYYLRSKE